METIVKHLKGGDVSLRTLCATALFKVRDNILYFRKLDKCELFLNVLSWSYYYDQNSSGFSFLVQITAFVI